MCEKFVISVKGSFVFIEESDILYFKADGSYCIIKLLDGTTYRQAKNLYFMFEKVNQKNLFKKIFRSYIVNQSAITKLEKDPVSHKKYFVYLNNGEKLPVSSSFVKELKQELKGIEA